MYGVKNNSKVCAEVLDIFSIVSGIGNHCTETEWNEYGSNAFKIFLLDHDIMKLLHESMKFEQYTIAKPLLQILGKFKSKVISIGNILIVDDSMAPKLAKLPEFYKMIKF